MSAPLLRCTRAVSLFLFLSFFFFLVPLCVRVRVCVCVCVCVCVFFPPFNPSPPPPFLFFFLFFFFLLPPPTSPLPHPPSPFRRCPDGRRVWRRKGGKQRVKWWWWWWRWRWWWWWCVREGQVGAKGGGDASRVRVGTGGYDLGKVFGWWGRGGGGGGGGRGEGEELKWQI